VCALAKQSVPRPGKGGRGGRSQKEAFQNPRQEYIFLIGRLPSRDRGGRNVVWG